MRWKTYTTSGLALGLLGCSMNPALVAADDCGTSTDWWAVDDCGDAASTAGIVENGNADEGEMTTKTSKTNPKTARLRRSTVTCSSAVTRSLKATSDT